MNENTARRWSSGFLRTGHIAVLRVEPLDYYYGGEPRYAFHTSLPGRGVRALVEAWNTPAEAWAAGVEGAERYEAEWPMANMAEVLGVTEIPDDSLRGLVRWAPVVNSYHSNT